MQAPERRSTLGFALRFLLIFAILTLAFEWSRGSAFERFVVEDLVLAPSARLIDLALPQDGVKLDGRVLSTPRSALRITRGCEGIEILLLLSAALLAYPAPWRHRLAGLAWGAVLAEVLSVARIIALHYSLLRYPLDWESLHGLILPLAPIAVVGIFFLRWTATAAGKRRAGDASAA